MDLEIIKYKHRLDNLFQKGSELTDDMELQAHWARYLCVLISGYLEVSVRMSLYNYAKQRADTKVSNYVISKLKTFQSPQMNNIIQLLGLFNSDWADEIKKRTDGELKAAVDSIVNNRHQIAHGKDVGMSLGQISSFYQSAIKVIELIDEVCQ